MTARLREDWTTLRTALRLLGRLESFPPTTRTQAAMRALVEALPDLYEPPPRGPQPQATTKAETRTCQNETVRENRARRACERRGLFLNKSRRRDPRASDYGEYVLSAGALLPKGIPVLTAKSLDDIERYLWSSEEVSP